VATLKDIRPSILDLPANEVMEIHRKIRESRRTPKKARSKAKARRTMEKKKILSVLDSLSVDDMNTLIKQLEG